MYTVNVYHCSQQQQHGPICVREVVSTTNGLHSNNQDTSSVCACVCDSSIWVTALCNIIKDHIPPPQLHVLQSLLTFDLCRALAFLKSRYEVLSKTEHYSLIEWILMLYNSFVNFKYMDKEVQSLKEAWLIQLALSMPGQKHIRDYFWE